MILSAQAFPPRSGGIENLMSALAHFAAASGETVHVFADGDKAAVHYDKEISSSYRVTRFSGLKPLRRRLKGLAVAKAASAGTLDSEQTKSIRAGFVAMRGDEATTTEDLLFKATSALRRAQAEDGSFRVRAYEA